MSKQLLFIWTAGMQQDERRNPNQNPWPVADDSADEETSWPYASLFFLGFFGTDSPGGKRLARRTTTALALMLAGAFALSLPGSVLALRLVWAALLPAGVLAMGWAYASYLRELDELSREMQLKAFAVAYFAVMAIGFGVFAYGAVRSGPQVRFDATAIFLLVLAEPIRAATLAWLARRYS